MRKDADEQRAKARAVGRSGRFRLTLLTALCCAVLVGMSGGMPGLHARAQTSDPAFARWLQEIWPQAQQQGVSRATFESATRGLSPDLSLPDLVIAGSAPRAQPEQAEFVQTPAQYLRESAFDRLAKEGRRLADVHRATLARIEREIGVRGEILLAVWGRETDFGRYKLPYDAVRVLATQAYTGRRKEMFRTEFIAALKLLEEGTPRAQMRSSWGGAMGLVQFLPSEFFKYATDFDGDGRADIFTSVPDALASAARQLVGKGWETGKNWAYEVRVPAGLDCTLADPDRTAPLGEWLARGFRPAYGESIPRAAQAESASLFLPAGLYGPAFLTPKNFYVIKAYNFSDLYVLFVGHLADRIRSGRPFETPWAKVAQPRTAQLEAMQRILTTRGFYADKIDGKAGQKTRLAIGAYQKAEGLVRDCWPTPALLTHMGVAAAR